MQAKACRRKEKELSTATCRTQERFRYTFKDRACSLNLTREIFSSSLGKSMQMPSEVTWSARAIRTGLEDVSTVGPGEAGERRRPRHCHDLRGCHISATTMQGTCGRSCTACNTTTPSRTGLGGLHGPDDVIVSIVIVTDSDDEMTHLNLPSRRSTLSMTDPCCVNVGGGGAPRDAATPVSCSPCIDVEKNYRSCSHWKQSACENANPLFTTHARSEAFACAGNCCHQKPPYFHDSCCATYVRLRNF